MVSKIIDDTLVMSSNQLKLIFLIHFAGTVDHGPDDIERITLPDIKPVLLEVPVLDP
jgi:hypothetical protein